MRLRINRTLLVKNIISFSMVLLFAAAMMLFVFQNFLLKNLNEFNDRQQRGLLMDGVENVQETLADVSSLMEQFGLYPELNPAYINRGSAEMNEAQSELRKCIRTDNSIIKECIFVSGRYSFALSNLTSYRVEYFLEMVQSPLFSECDDFSDVARALQTKLFMPVTVRGTDMLALNRAYQYQGFLSDTHVMMLLDSAEMMDLFNLWGADGDNSQAMIFLDGEPFLSTLEEPVTLEAIRGKDIVKLGESRYKVMLYEDSGGGIRICVFGG